MLPDIYNIEEFLNIEQEEDDEVEDETFTEYAYDFETNSFIYENGKIKIVEGLEALKIWINKTLKVKRFKYLAYSDDYGHELDNLIGTVLSSGAINSEAKRLLEECLFENVYITGVNNVTCVIKGEKVTVNATIETKFGEVELSV